MPKEKVLEWDYVTVPGPEDDAEGESKGVKYECKLCKQLKHKLWLYSNLHLLKRTQDLLQLGKVQSWREEEEEEETGQEGSSSEGDE
eukprot:1159935-Pelagomonas_calceolata.AAC.1